MHDDEAGLMSSTEELETWQPPEAYQQAWGEKVGLGRCPHCHKAWCWQAPNGWVCQLPKAFTPPDTPARKRAKKVPELWPPTPDEKEPGET